MNKLVLVTAAMLVPLVTYACSGDDENAPNEAAGAAAGQAGRASGASGGPTLGGAAGKGGTSGSSAGSPSGGARPLGGAAGSISSVGGVSGNSGAVGLAGRASIAGHAGTGSSVGAAGSGKVGSAGGPAGGTGVVVGGTSNGGRAGASAGVAGALTVPAAGSGGVGTSAAGTSASAGTGSAGVAGASNVSCNAPCLADAYGYSAGDAIPLCIPAITQSGVILCGATTCNGAAGCPMQATLGTTTWTLSAGSAARSTDVRLDTIVTSLTGPISATGTLNCVLNATLPTGGAPIAATGLAAPSAENPSIITLLFDQIGAPLTGVGVSSVSPADSFCVALVNANIANALPTMRAAMLDGINARAAALSCLECPDNNCPQHLACVAPAP